MMTEENAGETLRRLRNTVEEVTGEVVGRAKGAAEDAAGAARGAVRDARRWADDHAPSRLDGDDVRDTLFAAGRQAMAIVRDRPLLALGALAAFAYVMGRSNRSSSPNRRGIWF